MPKTVVRFTEQQVVLLEPMLKEETYGRTMPELVIRLLREYARQVLGREYRS